ncbi:PTS sugar transporter subunit IIA [Pediococcus acidilactici]
MSETAIESLFDPRIVYVSSGTTRQEVFKEVADDLVEKGYVKDSFLDNLNSREDDYPTGMDLSVVGPQYPNVAIPHTEANFVYKRRIVPVKLEHSIEFRSMINPAQSMNVRFLFMILNNDPEGQANVLAEIMEFLTQTPWNSLQHMFESDSPEEIFDFLRTNFDEK